MGVVHPSNPLRSLIDAAWKHTEQRRNRLGLAHGVRIANWIESGNIGLAAWRLRSEDPVRVLVDNSVRGQCATTHVAAKQYTHVAWPDERGHYAGLHRRAVKEGADKYADWLIGLAALARRGFIRFYESHALFLEQTYQESGRYNRGTDLFEYSAFNNVQFRTIDSYPQPRLPVADMTVVLKTFDGWGEVDPYGLYPDGKRQLRESLEAAKRHFPRYREIEKALQGKRSDQDAWHIFQADQVGIEYFLAADKNILEKARQGKAPFGNLNTKIVSPPQLGEELGVRPVTGVERRLWDWAIRESALNDAYRASDRERGA